jgi:hypothetical protein
VIRNLSLYLPSLSGNKSLEVESTNLGGSSSLFLFLINNLNIHDGIRQSKMIKWEAIRIIGVNYRYVTNLLFHPSMSGTVVSSRSFSATKN